MKTISILGSTGSIGTQTLDVIRSNKNIFKVLLLSSSGNKIDLFLSQIIEFKPKFVAINVEKIAILKQKISGMLDYELKIFDNSKESYEIIGQEFQVDILVAAIAGFAGVMSTITMAKYCKKLAIANKEAVLYANHILLDLKNKNGLNIVPIDSEHNSLHNLIQGKSIEQIKKYYLIASGGPFFRYSEDFSKITPQMALKHPKWSMGIKNSIDSATLVNKGIELIEAVKLFNIPENKIITLIHPQVIFHGMLTTNDNASYCFLSKSDMRLHISSAIFENNSPTSFVDEIDFIKIGALEFFEIDDEKFPSVKLARYAINSGDLAVISYNSADETLVEAFMNNRISFDKINHYLQKIVEYFSSKKIRNNLTYEEIFSYHKEVQNYANSIIDKL